MYCCHTWQPGDQMSYQLLAWAKTYTQSSVSYTHLGVERYTWNLARRCVAAGHRALVVTASLPGLPARETDADGIEILRLPSLPVMNGRFPVLKPTACLLYTSNGRRAGGASTSRRSSSCRSKL